MNQSLLNHFGYGDGEKNSHYPCQKLNITHPVCSHYLSYHTFMATSSTKKEAILAHKLFTIRIIDSFARTLRFEVSDLFLLSLVYESIS
jgi:hypothetical protein